MDVKCPDCDVLMEKGLVPEFLHSSVVIQSRWMKGPAAFSSLASLAFGGYAHAMRVTTFRCPECGLLREYALGK
ncbi:hypothetical protein Pan97_53020 [Bremerella volcania]|uniref:Uncharacterized protein n=1 Tax=Bremerella volcania TaxID=2527984 RepID=A0A518CG61_9BACT|nr:hypothetical protein [Bremerella volcania]QDU78218.1 hypothetical protein Pan97_53020 [Bremerella volcania]